MQILPYVAGFCIDRLHARMIRASPLFDRDWYLEHAETGVPAFGRPVGKTAGLWITKIRPEIDNLRSAFGWAREKNVAVAIGSVTREDVRR